MWIFFSSCIFFFFFFEFLSVIVSGRGRMSRNSRSNLSHLHYCCWMQSTRLICVVEDIVENTYNVEFRHAATIWKLMRFNMLNIPWLHLTDCNSQRQNSWKIVAKYSLKEFSFIYPAWIRRMMLVNEVNRKRYFVEILNMSARDENRNLITISINVQKQIILSALACVISSIIRHFFQL